MKMYLDVEHNKDNQTDGYRFISVGMAIVLVTYRS